MQHRKSVALTVVCALFVAAVPGFAAGEDGLPRTSDGRPDLSGTYNPATLTPLQRPVAFGDKLYLTEEEARVIEEREREFISVGLKESDPDREAPPEGGATIAGHTEETFPRESLGAGGVGGYNLFWIDRGTDAFKLDGKFRTSIIFDPPNGRMPPLTAEARAAIASRRTLRRPNTGTAWWLEQEGPGPYDNPEQLGLAERCLLGFSAGPPMLPGLYNNFKRIVQTPDHVMILVEMVHDARVIRLNSEHAPPEERKWLGDSIGWWEGDTLVVDTTNFRAQTGLRGASENLHLVERFRRIDEDHLLYTFTVEDPAVWTEPWSGEYVWPRSDNRLYEYACHEGNYSMGGILRGARLLEDEARAAEPSSGD